MGNNRAKGRPGRPKKRKFSGKPARKASVLAETPSDPAGSENVSDERLTASESELESSTSDGSDSVSPADSSDDGEDLSSSDDMEEPETSGYRFVDLECLATLLRKSDCCQSCHSLNVRFQESSVVALLHALNFYAMTVMRLARSSCRKRMSELGRSAEEQHWVWGVLDADDKLW